jgi:hypothetical protein
MSREKGKNDEKENNGAISARNFTNLTDKDLPRFKKHKKSFKKTRTKTVHDDKKIVPLLKPPSKRRKFTKDWKESNQENSQAGIVWDNKTIEEHYLERKLHPRTKIDEPKTPYPDIAEGVLQEGDKDNEVKHTEIILNNVVDSLNDKDKNKSNTKDLKKKAYSNEYTAALKFYNENKDKYEDFSGERKMSLENALINKFQNESKNINDENNH